MTRRPDAYALRHANLHVVGADLADADAVRAAGPGHGAVISAFDVPYSRRPITVYSEGMANLVDAMRSGGVDAAWR